MYTLYIFDENGQDRMLINDLTLEEALDLIEEHQAPDIFFELFVA